MRSLLAVIVLSLCITSAAQAHLVHKLRHESQARAYGHAKTNYGHAKYVCVRGTGRPKRKHCRALPWLHAEMERLAPAPPVDYWVAKQISAAETIGHEAAKDPWPNCADPIWDGASSWQVTVDCENTGNWYDSPGYYRCGLQFKPSWEARFGRLCP